MKGTPLIVSATEREALALLRERAAENPVDMSDITRRLKNPDEKAKHKHQMTQQSIDIPMGYLVVFSIETGHPCGAARHLSMSVDTVGRVPNEHAVWAVAELLGFEGGLDECMCWIESLNGHGNGNAVNVVQPIRAKGGTA